MTASRTRGKRRRRRVRCWTRFAGGSPPDTADGTEYDSLRILFGENGRMVRIVECLDSDDEDER